MSDDAQELSDAERADRLLKYWFAPGMDERWFKKDPNFDRELAINFGDDLNDAVQGKLSHWIDFPEGALALVILLDQIPRNVFRGKYQAFSFDSKAIAIAEGALLRGHDQDMPARQRRFLLLPFMHSENLRDQDYCIELFKQRGDDPMGLDFAQQHRDIIARFGRFPHRNEVLERETTPEEEEFLKTPGSSF